MTELLPVRPTHNGVFVDIIDRDVTKKDLGNGKFLHLLPDDTFSPNTPHNPVTGGKHPGVRPRWARVWGVGPEVDEVEPGDLVLCDTLKWGRRISLGRRGLTTVYFWRIAVDDILMIDDRADRAAYVREVQEQLSTVELNIGRL